MQNLNYTYSKKVIEYYCKGVAMLISALTQKGQVTIPAEIRHKLGLKTGDKIEFKLDGNKVFLKRVEPFDIQYHQALSNTLSEWDSPEDDEAYDDL